MHAYQVNALLLLVVAQGQERYTQTLRLNILAITTHVSRSARIAAFLSPTAELGTLAAVFCRFEPSASPVILFAFARHFSYDTARQRRWFLAIAFIDGRRFTLIARGNWWVQFSCTIRCSWSLLCFARFIEVATRCINTFRMIIGHVRNNTVTSIIIGLSRRHALNTHSLASPLRSGLLQH